MSQLNSFDNDFQRDRQAWEGGPPEIDRKLPPATQVIMDAMRSIESAVLDMVTSNGVVTLPASGSVRIIRLPIKLVVLELYVQLNELPMR